MELQTNDAVQASTAPQQKLFLEDTVGFVELLECFGSDLTVVNAARVSMNKESQYQTTTDFVGNVIEYKLADRDVQLIKYLALHRHVTPFFHPQVRMRIKMPIFVAREWYRHTIGFARNEVSRRYVSDAPECLIPTALRCRDKNVKQGSSDQLVENNDVVAAQMQTFIQQACERYHYLLEKGVCPEQARMVLPQSMYTEFIETASLAGYARLAILRLDPAAQNEIRDYAGMVASFMETLFPVSWPALMDVGKHLLL